MVLTRIKLLGDGHFELSLCLYNKPQLKTTNYDLGKCLTHCSSGFGRCARLTYLHEFRVPMVYFYTEFTILRTCKWKPKLTATLLLQMHEIYLNALYFNNPTASSLFIIIFGWSTVQRCICFWYSCLVGWDLSF